MVCSDGVFIIADKRIDDKLIVKKSANRIHEIDSNLIASFAGITADAKVLVERAQVLAQQNRLTYDSSVEPEVIIKEISKMKQQFTQYGGARPFGVSMMVAGVHNKKFEVFVSDVTGNYFSYHTTAIGENDEKIKEKLRDKYKKSLSIKEGIKIALEIYEKIFEDKFDIDRFELMYIKSDDEKIVMVEGKDILNIK
jgi:proteasome alpha subunit